MARLWRSMKLVFRVLESSEQKSASSSSACVPSSSLRLTRTTRFSRRFLMTWP